MYGLAKTAGLAGKVKNFVHDFTGENEERASQHLLNTLKAEKNGEALRGEVSHALKSRSAAIDNKHKSRWQGVAGLAGASTVANGVVLANAVHKKKQTRLEREEGL